jgi:hypothetical protein
VVNLRRDTGSKPPTRFIVEFCSGSISRYRAAGAHGRFDGTGASAPLSSGIRIPNGDGIFCVAAVGRCIRNASACRSDVVSDARDGLATRAGFDLRELLNIWRFVAGVSLITFIGAVLSQTDRILISKLMSLEQLGYYTVAATLAASLGRLTGPIIAAVSHN